MYNKRWRGNEPESRGQPSLIATTIYIDSTPTWNTYEADSPDLKRISSIGWGGANAKRTKRDLAIVRKASAHLARSHNQNPVSR